MLPESPQSPTRVPTSPSPPSPISLKDTNLGRRRRGFFPWSFLPSPPLRRRRSAPSSDLLLIYSWDKVTPLCPRVKSSFHCELNFLSSVNHPNIVRLLNFFQREVADPPPEKAKTVGAQEEETAAATRLYINNNMMRTYVKSKKDGRRKEEAQ
ncbi:hypothetical protein PIB30_096080 [Stylosanthes scabra]|uniref:Uncharacterized protein n=1 Tax=Stylosanthes scabra TaxID=79078 RepID=A0ABU6YTJ0_9FABA|nr:hypothetical protein [Stylosanthes scabra]